MLGVISSEPVAAAMISPWLRAHANCNAPPMRQGLFDVHAAQKEISLICLSLQHCRQTEFEADAF